MVLNHARLPFRHFGTAREPVLTPAPEERIQDSPLLLPFRGIFPRRRTITIQSLFLERNRKFLDSRILAISRPCYPFRRSAIQLGFRRQSKTA